MLGFGQCHNLSAKPMVVSYGFVSREADEEPVLHSGINHSKLKNGLLVHFAKVFLYR